MALTTFTILYDHHLYFQNFGFAKQALQPKAITPHSPLSQPCNLETTFWLYGFASIILKPNLKYYFKWVLEIKFIGVQNFKTALQVLQYFSGAHLNQQIYLTSTLRLLLGETEDGQKGTEIWRRYPVPSTGGTVWMFIWAVAHGNLSQWLTLALRRWNRFSLWNSLTYESPINRGVRKQNPSDLSVSLWGPLSSRVHRGRFVRGGTHFSPLLNLAEWVPERKVTAVPGGWPEQH